MVDERIDAHLAFNLGFAIQQGLSREEIAALGPAYEAMFDVLNNPEKYDDPVAKVTELEYDLQERWHFPRDAKYHKYQMYIKGCTCPKMDNAELVGATEDRYRVSDCPWHWTEADKEFERQRQGEHQ